MNVDRWVEMAQEQGGLPHLGAVKAGGPGCICTVHKDNGFVLDYDCGREIARQERAEKTFKTMYHIKFFNFEYSYESAAEHSTTLFNLMATGHKVTVWQREEEV